MAFNVVAYLKQAFHQVRVVPHARQEPIPSQAPSKPNKRQIDPAEQNLASHIDDMCDCVDA